MKLLLLTLTNTGEELTFVAPQHVVQIATDPQSKHDNWEDTGSLVYLVTGDVLRVEENRNDVADMLEKASTVTTHD